MYKGAETSGPLIDPKDDGLANESIRAAAADRGCAARAAYEKCSRLPRRQTVAVNTTRARYAAGWLSKLKK